MAPRRTRSRKARAARTAASTRPSRRARTEAAKKIDTLLAPPKPAPKPGPTYVADREDKDSFLDNNIPVEIYKELMKHLDDGSATCLGLVNKKTHAAWLDVYQYSSITLDTKVYPPPGGLTLQLSMVLYTWVPSNLFYDAFNGMFKTNRGIADSFECFIEGTEEELMDEAARERDEQELRLEQEEREAEEERYYRQQRRLHAGTVAQAYGVSGYDSDKEYDSDLEPIDEDDEMDEDEDGEEEEGDDEDDEMDEDE